MTKKTHKTIQIDQKNLSPTPVPVRNFDAVPKPEPFKVYFFGDMSRPVTNEFPAIPIGKENKKK